jgi:hypothetical protein
METENIPRAASRAEKHYIGWEVLQPAGIETTYEYTYFNWHDASDWKSFYDFHAYIRGTLVSWMSREMRYNITS